MFLPLVSRSVVPVCFNISPLYQIIISSHQFHQLSYYISPISNENYKHHEGLRDPESTRLRKKYLLSSTSSELTYNFSATNYIVPSGNAEKDNITVIMCFNLFLACSIFGLVKPSVTRPISCLMS